MTVVSTTPDPQTLTFTVVADFDTPPERVWQVWADPRQLKRWWGPPTWPATFTQHDLVVGGTSMYHMTGPEGEQAHGWFRFTAVDEPRSFELEDGFADDSGEPDGQLPVTLMRMELEGAGAGTRMTLTSRFASLEQMEQMTAMGMVEGITAAMGQVDDLLVAA